MSSTLNPTVGTFQGDVGLQFNPAPIDWSALGDAGGVKDVAEGFSFGLGMGEIANKGAAQIGALNILNRANPLQRGRMDSIGKAATFEDLDGVVSDLSKSGQWIGKFAPAAKYLGVAGVVTDAVVTGTDVYNAPTLDQKAMVAAQDTTSFAGELAAAEGGATGLSALVDPFSEFAGPYAPFVIAGAGILGGIGGLAAYNFTPIKNEIKAGVAQFVTGVDDVIENPHIIVDTAKSDWTQFKSDAQATAAYLEYLSVPEPKGPYQP